MRKLTIVATSIGFLAALSFGCRSNQEEASPEPAKEGAEVVQRTLEVTAPPLSGQVKVEILKLGSIDPPENAELKVTLARISDVASRSTETIASKSVPANKFPIEVAIPYDSSKIEKRERYIVYAMIYDGDKLIFATDREVPVLTYGVGEKTQIIVKGRNIISDRHLVGLR